MDKNLAYTVLRLALCALAVWAVIAWALPLLLPFVIGLILALCMEPATRWMSKRLKLSRALGSVATLLGLYVLLGFGLYLGLRRAGYELSALAAALPGFLESLAQPMARVRTALEGLAARAPDSLGTALTAYVDSLFSGGEATISRASQKTLTLLTQLVSRLPGLLLGLFTAVLSSFFFALELPGIRLALQRLPDRWAGPFRRALRRVREALGGWLRAQCRLMAVTFAIVTAGLLLIGVDYALVLGVVTALVDALPVFGSGTILLPWAALSFLRGETALGVELAVLYAAAALTRQVLEPRWVGRQMGLSPLLTLMAVYVGFRLFGVAGMLLLPIAAVVVRQLLLDGGGLPKEAPNH